MPLRRFPLIHIIGLPGAGKTTLSRKLSRRWKIPAQYRIDTSRKTAGEVYAETRRRIEADLPSDFKRDALAVFAKKIGKVENGWLITARP